MDKTNFFVYIFIWGILIYALFIVWVFISQYLNRARFEIRVWKLIAIEWKKEKDLCDISEISEIYVESWHSGSGKMSVTQHTLTFFNWNDAVGRFFNSGFSLSQAKSIAKKLRAHNPKIQFTRYNRDSFLNILPSYRKRKRP